jgi:hypothetical protein
MRRILKNLEAKALAIFWRYDHLTHSSSLPPLHPSPTYTMEDLRQAFVLQATHFMDGVLPSLFTYNEEVRRLEDVHVNKARPNRKNFDLILASSNARNNMYTVLEKQALLMKEVATLFMDYRSKITLTTPESVKTIPAVDLKKRKTKKNIGKKKNQKNKNQ